MQKFGQFPKREEGKYYISDIESGYPYEVSKEHWEWYQSMFRSFSVGIDPEKFGSMPIIFGTAGEMETGNDISQLFFWIDTANQENGK